MSAISNIGLITAFMAGLVSFLSPCVLPLVPGYISYVSGNALARQDDATAGRLVTLSLSLCFILGFSAVFVGLGATTTVFSRLLSSYRDEATLIGGAMVIFLGVFMTGLVRVPWFERDLRFHGSIRGGRPISAFLLGLAFGFGWTPCIGPVLGAILTVSALSSTASAGIVLLAIYSLGFGVPFLLSAVFADHLMRRLKAVRKLGRALQVGAGGVMVAMGVAMMTGTMTVFSFWLLENVPILAGIG
ncbi:cytochrome c biogenesis protein CcdA (plasmid) [Sinorhizobium numidicum]|uniref:Cytochrome c biogenesis protein CcdA n=1 Tax=Sinorhizobium numidicum TaxID=680248 RepID=A0ABY8D3E0_9HYPH|nr:cytochrome c biogenesis protein CcdA [Sinorhizobium numidicum]WEX79648.1 cytochrome c biogenesis protein CcdA [Sinorhizobium numidicum]WEX85398.1 cytochrome c biogenesis protein CcdA [Sinorhizobium numidicum]